MLRREQIERLKERYPAGTVVRLGQMEGEHQMPSGMEGKVIGVDDIGQIHVEWENGSTLALNVEEDDFTVVPQKETLSEKKCREFLGKINEILKETDFYLLNVSCNGGDTAYAAQKLLAMHQAFETVYGEGYVDEEVWDGEDAGRWSAEGIPGIRTPGTCHRLDLEVFRGTLRNDFHDAGRHDGAGEQFFE